MRLSESAYNESKVEKEPEESGGTLHMSKDDYEQSQNNKTESTPSGLKLSTSDYEESKQDPKTPKALQITREAYNESKEQPISMGTVMKSINEMLEVQRSNKGAESVNEAITKTNEAISSFMEKADQLLSQKPDDSAAIKEAVETVASKILESLKEVKEAITKNAPTKKEWDFAVKRDNKGFITSVTAKEKD